MGVLIFIGVFFVMVFVGAADRNVAFFVSCLGIGVSCLAIFVPFKKMGLSRGDAIWALVAFSLQLFSTTALFENIAQMLRPTNTIATGKDSSQRKETKSSSGDGKGASGTLGASGGKAVMFQGPGGESSGPPPGTGKQPGKQGEEVHVSVVKLGLSRKEVIDIMGDADWALIPEDKGDWKLDGEVSGLKLFWRNGGCAPLSITFDRSMKVSGWNETAYCGPNLSLFEPGADRSCSLSDRADHCS